MVVLTFTCLCSYTSHLHRSCVLCPVMCQEPNLGARMAQVKRLHMCSILVGFAWQLMGCRRCARLIGDSLNGHDERSTQCLVHNFWRGLKVTSIIISKWYVLVLVSDGNRPAASPAKQQGKQIQYRIHAHLEISQEPDAQSGNNTADRMRQTTCLIEVRTHSMHICVQSLQITVKPQYVSVNRRVSNQSAFCMFPLIISSC